MTDKGSINQRAVLAHRAALVQELYAEPPPDQVLVFDQGLVFDQAFVSDPSSSRP
jgi:hypothetical protein